ncbi:hypothetical protein HD593_001907 [Nonomuraea rubra]|uniref:Uncharacterized protein n=1 Tax=Nonomuraea rubra TaxID=46180 RepID=A0A7X0TX16_9ACTN|nr:hypothetical protein [Nonomuraea rubra]
MRFDGHRVATTAAGRDFGRPPSPHRVSPPPSGSAMRFAIVAISRSTPLPAS